jgi:YD repeat-containing protein
LIYDAENRLVEVKKNSDSTATFIYDGDGNRVKSTINGVTTYFIGVHYIIPVGDEVTGSTVTKYYGVYGAGSATGAQHPLDDEL